MVLAETPRLDRSVTNTPTSAVAKSAGSSNLFRRHSVVSTPIEKYSPTYRCLMMSRDLLATGAVELLQAATNVSFALSIVLRSETIDAAPQKVVTAGRTPPLRTKWNWIPAILLVLMFLS